MLLLGDCLEQMNTLADNSVDAIVTDPPYFLTNGAGSGFMGKEWDSLSVANAFAEAILKSLKPVWLMGAESSAQESANINSKNKNQGHNISALFAQKNFTEANHKLNQSTFSVLESVLTRAEVLALSSALSKDLTNAIESQPENVLYVVTNSFTEKCPRSIAQELALRLHINTLCEEIKILHTLMADQNLSGLIGATTGPKLENKFTPATITDVKNVENIVADERYNATTLLHIDTQKIIRHLTSLRFVRNAMATFTENPSNIQILSERFHYRWAKEAFRVLKPGAHILAFAGTRTYHPLANAVQSAGFEIRDQVQWIYGSGFPKSHNVSKAIDKMAGVEREVIGESPNNRPAKTKNGAGFDADKWGRGIQGESAVMPITAPATPEAKQWDGWGSALKPANEPICLARKPLEKGLTLAENVLKWGTGGLNIDASRVATEDNLNGGTYSKNSDLISNPNDIFGERRKVHTGFVQPQCRWPANVLFDEDAAQMLDAQSIAGGIHSAGKGRAKKENFDQSKSMFGIGHAAGSSPRFEDSTIGASRFFYVAKASKRERNAGLEGMPEKATHRYGAGIGEGLTPEAPSNDKNFHPTVKPIKLMEYLITLITPPNGTVLDPFMGSGSTGVAAKNLGREFIGCEMSPEYFEIAKRRIEA